MHIPKHLAIIMDGNGRWARNRQLPRLAGHARGVETVRTVVQECARLGVEYLTLYAFSSENWRRPGDEVSGLMSLLAAFLRSELASMQEYGIRLSAIGDLALLPEQSRRVLQETMEATASNDKMVLNLALSYGGRDEIIRAMASIGKKIETAQLSSLQIDEALICDHLDTRSLPDPDLLIRTSGEMRISNFLLWQIAYSELVFTDVLWPDFGVEELHRAIEEFSLRERRFGLTGDQLQTPET